jgi:predicted amidohydrolase YtcJ
VVGQPSLVYGRGDIYMTEYPSEQHPWLHRARSLVDAGIRYAAGSDAPVTEPDPITGMIAARTRLTARGVTLGRQEALAWQQALAAFTLWPARAVGIHFELGRLRAGMLADMVLLAPDVLTSESAYAMSRPVRATIMEGRVVWPPEDGNG